MYYFSISRVCSFGTTAGVQGVDIVVGYLDTGHECQYPHVSARLWRFWGFAKWQCFYLDHHASTKFSTSMSRPGSLPITPSRLASSPQFPSLALVKCSKPSPSARYEGMQVGCVDYP